MKAGFSEETLEKLRKAYASGVLRVKVGETLLEYKTEEEMRRTIQTVERGLGKKKSGFTQLRYNKGL